MYGRQIPVHPYATASSGVAAWDPPWLAKKDEWSEEAANALRFFEEHRVPFASEELPTSTFEPSSPNLEESVERIFVIERHLPSDLVEDRAILLRALENAAR